MQIQVQREGEFHPVRDDEVLTDGFDAEVENRYQDFSGCGDRADVFMDSANEMEKI